MVGYEIVAAQLQGGGGDVTEGAENVERDVERHVSIASRTVDQPVHGVVQDASAGARAGGRQQLSRFRP